MCDVESLIDSLKNTEIPKESIICIDEIYVKKAINNFNKIKTIIIAQDPYPKNPMDIPVFLEKFEDILEKRIGRLVFKEILRPIFLDKIFKEKFPSLNKELKYQLPSKIVKNKKLYELGYEGFFVSLSDFFSTMEDFATYLLEKHGVLFLNSRYWIDTSNKSFNICGNSDNLNTEIFRRTLSKNNISIYCIGVSASQRLRFILKKLSKDSSYPLSIKSIDIENAVAIDSLPKYREIKSKTLAFDLSTLQIFCMQYPK